MGGGIVVVIITANRSRIRMTCRKSRIECVSETSSCFESKLGFDRACNRTDREEGDEDEEEDLTGLVDDAVNDDAAGL